jgi:regulator of protease activity HflC (stomatin/prohibitin superfamily)
VIFAILVAVVLLIFGLRSAIVVPADSAYVVERLGRYHRTLTAGMQMLTPFIDRVAFRYALLPQESMLTDTCISRDNIPVQIESTYSWQITNAERAAYQSANVGEHLQSLVRSCQRDAISGRTLEDARETTRELQGEVLRAVTQPAASVGVEIVSFNVRRVQRAVVAS